MARTTSACPRGRLALAQAPIAGLGTLLFSLSKEKFANERSLQVAAGLHLLAIAASVLGPSSVPLPIFLTITGLFLVVVVILRSGERDAAAPSDVKASAGMTLSFDASMTGPRLQPRAELRDPLWAELSSRMSHELRTPLNAIIGFSDLIDAEIFGPIGHDRYRDYVRHIRESSRGLLKATEDTLALTTSLAGPSAPTVPRPLNLAALISEAWNAHEAEAQARLLHLEPAVDQTIEVLGELRPVRQVLVNLLAEAMARANDGADVHVAAYSNGSVVTLTLEVDHALPREAVGQAPLAICIARVLLEQHGSRLIEEVSETGIWRAIAFFDCASQQDFFAEDPARTRTAHLATA